jgi:hypothetical protein
MIDGGTASPPPPERGSRGAGSSRIDAIRTVRGESVTPWSCESGRRGVRAPHAISTGAPSTTSSWHRATRAGTTSASIGLRWVALVCAHRQELGVAVAARFRG